MGKKFSTEKLCVFSKKVQLTQFLVEMFLRVPFRTSSRDFLIFWFIIFLQGLIHEKMAFFHKKSQNKVKKDIFSWIRPCKKIKNQNIKKSLCGVLEGTQRYIYTQNLVNWTFFLETHKLSGKVFFSEFLPGRQKNECFLP